MYFFDLVVIQHSAVDYNVAYTSAREYLKQSQQALRIEFTWIYED